MNWRMPAMIWERILKVLRDSSLEMRSVTLTIARFLILQTVELVRQRAQGFCQQTQLGAVDRQFTGLGFEQFTFSARDVAQSHFLNCSL